MKKIFRATDILLPKNCDMTKWATIACDQYTSQPEYWNKVVEIVGDSPSTLKISLPEIYLEDEDVEKRISEIQANMYTYLNSGVFECYSDSMIYVERTLPSGKVRHGIVGAIDLEEYDFSADSVSPIRATEGTIISRLPPRVRIRKDALVELPHILILYDDPSDTLVQGLSANKVALPELYNFELMQGAGSIAGYRLDGGNAAIVERTFATQYDTLCQTSKSPLLFAMGDGNHSLATAKQCYENLKQTMTAEEYLNHPARFVLAEMINVHDEALEFEPIYRVMFGVNPEKVIADLDVYFTSHNGDNANQDFEFVSAVSSGEATLTTPPESLIIGSLQGFIDDYLEKNGGTVDYIHGEDAVRQLCARTDAVGFLYSGMKKGELFAYVGQYGVLPRKTFSMGHADEKRFYLECRKIVK